MKKQAVFSIDNGIITLCVEDEWAKELQRYGGRVLEDGKLVIELQEGDSITVECSV